MRRVDSLRTVLEVRRRREEIAERALAATAQEILRCRDQVAYCRAALAGITASRVLEIQCVAGAEQHQCHEARYRALVQQRAEAETNLERLQALRVEQMSAYMAARHSREVVGELEERVRALHNVELSMREQKWNDEMFLMRRVSNFDKKAAQEELDGTKELRGR